MTLEITQYAIDHLVASVEFTMQDADVLKKEEVIDDVIDGAQYLLSHPRAGQLEVRRSDGVDYRRWVVRHFKIIYRIDGDRVLVTDIFDSRQDPMRVRL